MDPLKVTVESLHVNKIKEINYEGEESFQEKQNVSQRLKELAQRVDFSEAIDDEGSEPAAKKSAQRWPWEFTHSKLKQALTEVSVLSDVLQIILRHPQYISLLPVNERANKPDTVPPAYQYIVKKKALSVAAGILRKGTSSLSKSSSRGEREFHDALLNLRQRWRLRRMPNGTIQGDLSYRSAGSTYIHSGGVVKFDVRKGEVASSSSSTGGAAKDSGTATADADVIVVNVPRELRGRSEIIVYLSEKPVRDMPSLDSVVSSSLEEFSRHHHGNLPPWEKKLVAAQNVLFNQELFTTLAHQAYDQKPQLQYEVYSNRINVPLNMNYWLSILHVREYETDQSSPRPPTSIPSSSSSLPDSPRPRWDLVVALKQLLRSHHHGRSTLHPPRPSTMGFSDAPKLRNAGIVPFNTAEIKQLSKDEGIFAMFLSKAKHTYNEENLNQWLSELCSKCTDPALVINCVPESTLKKTIFILTLNEGSTGSTYSANKITISLVVDKLSMQLIDGRVVSFYVEKERLMRILRHQVVVYRMQIASRLAEAQKWYVLQQSTRPMLSPALAKSSKDFMETCSLLLESPDAHRKVQILFEWLKTTVNVTKLATPITPVEDVGAVAPETKSIDLNSLLGPSFQQKFMNLLVSS